MSDIFDVKLSTKAGKDLKKLPLHIALKLQAWVDAVGHRGLNEVKKVPGYHVNLYKEREKVNAQYD